MSLGCIRNFQIHYPSVHNVGFDQKGRQTSFRLPPGAFPLFDLDTIVSSLWQRYPARWASVDPRAIPAARGDLPLPPRPPRHARQIAKATTQNVPTWIGELGSIGAEGFGAGGARMLSSSY